MILNWILLIFILVSFVGIFSQGLNNDLVIYQNKKDFYRVALTILVVALSFIIVESSPYENQNLNTLINWIVFPICILLSTVLFIDNFLLCTINNEKKIFIGFVIVIYRYFYMIIAFLIIFLSLYNGSGKRRSVARLLLNITVASSTAYITYLLINGTAVDKKRRQSLNHLQG